MTQIKFKTPIAMKCTQEQYDRDLKQPLKDLGYVELDMDRDNGRCNLLSTGWRDCNQIGYIEEKLSSDYLIPTYNPKLYISLAGMTEGEDWIVGEWLVYEYNGELFEVKGFEYADYQRGQASTKFKGLYRKATKEELIEYFTEEVEESNTIRDRILKRFSIPSNYDKHDFEMAKYSLNDVIEVVEEFLEIEEVKKQLTQYKGEIEGFPRHIVEEMLDEQERQGNKRDVTVFEKYKMSGVDTGGFNWCNSILSTDTWKDIIDNRKFHLIEQAKPQQPKKNKFPFTLSLEEAKRLVGIAPREHKGILARTLGKLFMLEKDLEVSEIRYEEMREIFNTEQQLVLDEIFGKDEEVIPDGTPCLVRSNGWSLKYADGKGQFYFHGAKKGHTSKWDEYQVLDINNLPVTE